jgi:virginiamycin B lyase
VAGPDGALWFTQNSGGYNRVTKKVTREGVNQIGRISTGGAVAGYPISAPGNGPFGIAPGRDGALWFTENTGHQIGRMTTEGRITNEYDIGTQPGRISAGPDDALWFTDSDSQTIGSIATNGTVTRYAISRYATFIAAGPDGTLWFTDMTANKIGRLRPKGR